MTRGSSGSRRGGSASSACSRVVAMLYSNAAKKEISKALMPWAEGTSLTRGWAGWAKPGSMLRSGRPKPKSTMTRT
eukprot:6854476-Prymnesium_polylepis.1